MKFTLSWLKEHLDTSADLSKIVNTLTMIGLEVEKVLDPMETLANFKVAAIHRVKKHPNADRLKVCEVDTGKGALCIVCGAENAHAGIKTVLAEIGTCMPSTNRKIQKTRIRGVCSCGMLCSFDDLGLEGPDGIIELDSNAPLGARYVSVANLDDPVIHIAITPNRGDCLGVRGIARDLAAAGVGSLKALPLLSQGGDHKGFSSPISWQLATDHAPDVIGRMFKDVKNGPSPPWLQRRLTAIGLASKSALVDISNYICFDLGRPLHIFDADKIGKILTIRSARKGESFVGLDGKKYDLCQGMTVVADDEKILSLAGIIGAMTCAVTTKTKNIFIESAWFDPMNITETMRRVGVSSDSSYRFERTVDPMSNPLGITAATRLISAVCGGKASHITVAGTPKFTPRILLLRFDAVFKKSGIQIPQKHILSILKRLKIQTKPQGENVVECVIPSHRSDIEGEHCLIEEVLRIYGYEHIPMNVLPLPQQHNRMPPAISPLRRAIGRARRALTTVGMFETITYAFISLKEAEAFTLMDSVSIKNPISQDLSTMRPSVLPSLLSAYGRNKARGFGDLALFEVGATYFRDATGKIEQRTVISGIRCGYSDRRHWSKKRRLVHVFDAKADVLIALDAMDVLASTMRFKTPAPKWYHPGKSAVLYRKDDVAYFGEIHPASLKNLGISGPVVGFEIFIDALSFKNSRKSKPFTPSPLQPLYRDFAFEVKDNLDAETLVRIAKNSDRRYIVDVKVFDVFKGEGIEEGHKSIAIVVTLQPRDKALNDKEIHTISGNIIDAVIKNTGGKLR